MSTSTGITGSGNKQHLTLLELQNKIKRDPSCYEDEFRQQLQHFDSSLEIFRLNPSAEADEFGSLVNFLSHVTSCFPGEADTKTFPGKLLQLLEDHADIMSAALRRSLCRAAMLLKSKKQLPLVRVYELFFKLFRCKDKLLRETLHSYIVTDIRKANLKSKNQQLNKVLQNFMYTMINDVNHMAAHKSVLVMIDLYRKSAWRDEKTVNVIADACFSQHTKVKVASIKFFLGIDEELEDQFDEDDFDDSVVKDVKMSLKVGKKTNKKKAKVTNAIMCMKKHQRKDKKKQQFDFSALHLINNPQGMAERLFKELKTTNERFEVRLTMMNLISRLIGVHELIVLNFYPFLQKYLNVKQNEVTSILTYLAQACHPLVPPETLEPVILALCNNFVSDKCSPEVITVGLNAVRELCTRCPLAMTDSLLQDLTQYKKYKDKGVTMAARSLIALFRSLNPELLARKDRGKDGSENLKQNSSLKYGQVEVSDFIPGTELLDDFINKEQQDQEEGDVDGDWEEVDDDDDMSDGEWVNVDHNESLQDNGKDDNDATAAAAIGDVDKEKARTISTTRILTQEDFKLIRKRMLEKAAGIDNSNEKTSDGIVSIGTIENLHKKRKMDKAQRIASIEEGRLGRERFGSSKNDTRTGGLTNQAKLKNKNFMMVLKSRNVRKKKSESLMERKTRQRTAARKQKKRHH